MAIFMSNARLADGNQRPNIVCPQAFPSQPESALILPLATVRLTSMQTALPTQEISSPGMRHVIFPICAQTIFTKPMSPLRSSFNSATKGMLRSMLTASIAPTPRALACRTLVMETLPSALSRPVLGAPCHAICSSAHDTSSNLLHSYQSAPMSLIVWRPFKTGYSMAELVRDQANAYAVVLDDAVNDRGLAMTSSFSNMVLFGQCLAHLWSEKAYDVVFEALVRAGEAFLPMADAAARELAVKKYQRVCVLGSGALTSVAKESALKMLEMTAGGVKTMAESVLGLRHGPMAALDKETLLVCFAASDARLQQYEADLLQEIGKKEIVAQRVAVGSAGLRIFRHAASSIWRLRMMCRISIGRRWM